MVRSNVYMICGRWIQTRKTLSIVSQHLCIRRARMFTWSETKPFTAHMPAHYYSACVSLVYRMRAVDQCAVANYSQHTSEKATVPNIHRPYPSIQQCEQNVLLRMAVKKKHLLFFLPIQGNCTHCQYV